MFVLVSLTSLAVIFFSMVYLIFSIFKRDGKIKNAGKGLLAGVLLFIFAVAINPDNEISDSGTNQDTVQNSVRDREYKKIKDQRWTEEVTEKFNLIGVKKIKDFSVTNDYVLIFKTDKYTLDVYLSSKTVDGKTVPKVNRISDKDNSKLVFYDSEEDNTDKLAIDLYDYKTGEIRINADAEAIANAEKLSEEMEKNRAEMEKNRQEAKDRFPQENLIKSENFIEEVYNAYKENKLKADDLYEGKKYIITGTFETVKDDGLINKALSQIGVTLTLEKSPNRYILLCKFDKNERDKLKEFSKGDLISFEGTLYGWGSWGNCTVKE